MIAFWGILALVVLQNALAKLNELLKREIVLCVVRSPSAYTKLSFPDVVVAIGDPRSNKRISQFLVPSSVA